MTPIQEPAPPAIFLWLLFSCSTFYAALPSLIYTGRRRFKEKVSVHAMGELKTKGYFQATSVWYYEHDTTNNEQECVRCREKLLRDKSFTSSTSFSAIPLLQLRGKMPNTFIAKPLYSRIQPNPVSRRLSSASAPRNRFGIPKRDPICPFLPISFLPLWWRAQSHSPNPKLQRRR